MERDYWRIGELLLAIRAKFDWSYRKIAEKVTIWGKSQYQQIASTCEVFPPELREPGVEFGVYQSALKSNVPGPNRKPKTPAEIAEMIKGGARTPREITEALETKREQDFAEDRKTEMDIVWAPQLDGVINRPHAAPWEEAIEQLPDGEIIDAVWADPMFGAYERDQDKTITTKGPARIMTGAANAEMDSARATGLPPGFIPPVSSVVDPLDPAGA